MLLLLLRKPSRLQHQMKPKLCKLLRLTEQEDVAAANDLETAAPKEAEAAPILEITGVEDVAAANALETAEP